MLDFLNQLLRIVPFKQATEDKDGELEPRLLIYDGHLSHMWYGTIDLARQKSVTILKLPPHTTDRLKPLDVAVFKSLKDHSGDVLFQRNNTSRLKLSKAEFETILSREDVWKKSFSIENIQKGFIKCSIYPVDTESYPKERFNPNLKKRYDIWVENGKPELARSELDDLENDAFKNKEVADTDDDISLNELH